MLRLVTNKDQVVPMNCWAGCSGHTHELHWRIVNLDTPIPRVVVCFSPGIAKSLHVRGRGG